MNLFNRQLFIRFFYIAIDIFLAAIAIYIACHLRAATLSFDVTFENIFLSTENSFRNVFLFWLIITILLNNSHGLYETKREVIESSEIWNVIRSVIISALIVIIVFYALKIVGFPRTILLLTTIISIISFSVWRYIKRLMVGYLVAQGYNNFNVVIVGAGRVGRALHDEIKERPQLGIKIVGFLDDFKKKDDLKEDNYPSIVGTLSEFKKISQQQFIHKVFITIHPESKVFMQLLEEARDLGIAVRVVPQGFELMSNEFCKYNIGFIPILEYCDLTHRKLYGKSLFDVFIATILIIILFPFFLIVAGLIKLDSRGPVFYYSRRFGRRGRIFPMLKFRSMVSNADDLKQNIQSKNEVDGPIFKIKNDPRTTRIGKFLRKYSLDELPQIINILRGEMSLVGPRPLPIDQIEREDLRQLKRLEVKPGITGLWQIRGRSDLSFARLIKWDIWYISNWSFWLDFTILLQTIPVVIKGKGAY